MNFSCLCFVLDRTQFRKTQVNLFVLKTIHDLKMQRFSEHGRLNVYRVKDKKNPHNSHTKKQAKCNSQVFRYRMAVSLWCTAINLLD